MRKREISHLIITSVFLLVLMDGCSNSPDDSIENSTQESETYLVADAGADRSIDIPDKVDFETPLCDAKTVEWDFGDGEKAQGFKVTYDYKTPGRYTVKVTLTDSDSETVSDTCIVTVYPKDSDGDLLEDAIDDDPKNGDINSPRDSKVFFLDTFDGEKLECQLFLPGGEPPYPVIMIGHGWDSDLTEMAGRAKNYRDAGYATFVWSARGWGKSTGLIRLDSTQYEIKDTIRLINWLAEQKFVIEENKPEWFFENGKIINYDFDQDGLEEKDDIPGDETRDFVLGMNGCSYGGALQVLTASYDHRIDCISPERTWNNLLDALCPSESLKILWAGGFYLQGMARVLQGTGVDPMLTDFILTLLSTNVIKPEMRDQLLLRTPETRISKVLAPALVIQGELDTVFDLNQAIANLEEIQANGVEGKMYWYSGGHGYFPENPENIEGMVLAWMDKHLRGMNVDTGPEFEYDVITEDWKPGDKQNIRSGDWPLVERDKETKFVLHGVSKAGDLLCTNNLGRPIPYSDNAESYAADESTSSKVKNIPFRKTSLSEIQALKGTLKEIYPPFDSPETSMTFESGEFHDDTEITGIPRIKVWLSSSASDITYFFKLYDAPSAFSSIQWEDPDKVNTDAKVINWHVTPYRVYNGSKDSPQMHEIDLRAITYIIKKGHRIRLTIATSDFFFLQSRIPGDGFIWHDAEHPSCLWLPIVR